MSDSKYCVNCRHYDGGLSGVFDPTCKRPVPWLLSLVDGLPDARTLYCKNQRAIEDEDFCGPEGKFFEAK
jgi:hypothetical protein